MTPSVTLLMAIHCHQPVGNFGFVFEEAYAKSYDPFLRVLERHPEVRLSLHYSGCLLDWLLTHRPEFLDRIQHLVTRGQVELLASGYYEPILPLLPEADRQGQIAQMRAALKNHFRTDAKGLWLTERVWEPELPASLSRAGIRYTTVDTNQFAGAKAGLPSALQVQDEVFWDLLGSYMTEYAGFSVRVFPASKRLRYWMPFQRVEQTLDFLRRLKREQPVAITFADDGEKFGFWPKTHQWVYDEGWLDQFFSALERERSWLSTTTFQAYVETVPADGSVYLPCGSYEEMLEWSGGYFRNFFTKYPEANALYQKMLGISRTLTELRASPLQVPRSKHQTKRQGNETGRRPLAAKRREVILRQAKQALYTGQCNCAYWHGVFGGLYLAHLRRAVYAHLIAAEQLANQASGATASVTVLDADGDGREEIRLKTSAMSVLVDPAEGGAITEWSLYGPRVNLLDTLSRRYEPYHEKLKANPQPAAVSPGGVTPASIHDTLGVKEENLASHLVYDDHRRSAWLDYALQQRPTLQEVVTSTWGERRLWSSGPFAWTREPRRARASTSLNVTLVRAMDGGRIRKNLRVFTEQATLECCYELERVRVPVVGLEFNVALRDERYLHTPQELQKTSRFEMTELALGASLRMSLDPPATLMHFPIETVSESEEGLERTYQGLCVMCFWTPAQATWKSRVMLSVEDSS